MLFQTDIDVAPNHREESNNVISLFINAIPWITKMENEVSFNIEPFNMVWTLGISPEYTISAASIFVKMEQEECLEEKVELNIARYNNKGGMSQLIKN